MMASALASSSPAGHDALRMAASTAGSGGGGGAATAAVANPKHKARTTRRMAPVRRVHARRSSQPGGGRSRVVAHIGRVHLLRELLAVDLGFQAAAHGRQVEQHVGGNVVERRAALT